MSAKASGADPRANGNGEAKARQHHDGSAGRAFTVEQKAAVIRIKRCGATAYYEILGLEEVKTTCTEGEIKKAYRKLSLLTHPDKNGYEGADDAFKMVSRAFQVLSDPEKKVKYDKFGGDPDARFNPASAGAGASPFSNFPRPSGGRSGSMFEEEISPEEMFRQFFGGGGAFGGPFGGGFDTGGFVFNMGGGGPGIRVHQFGGGRPRRRPTTAASPGAQEQPTSVSSTLTSLLPLILIFIILPFLHSLFDDSTPGPSVYFDSPRGLNTHGRTSGKLNIPYWVNPAEVQNYRKTDWRKLDQVAETKYVHVTNVRCEHEQVKQRKMKEEAMGWFSDDEVKMEAARKMPMPNCKKLKDLGVTPRF
ncbi:DnaJ-domain-containing protein [Massarina eburnea CBS 473.64]|uniref:DnaJ-domain-containing protein n=1 Tax=Massarina eburnea CBS 473.64 TaxID=1395130 RepID=A0A6A6S3K0_9PLEO|nr:DnaJ-domain-containing protein [Massarina eburnea CBS 473.64]